MNNSMKILTSVLVLMFLFSCQASDEQSNTQSRAITEDMLQHNVYFYLNEDVTQEEADQFLTALEELIQIPEIHKAAIGKPAATKSRDVTDHSFAYSIFTWFESMEDYEVYAEHPVHMEFVEAYEQFLANVRVYDSDIIETR